MLGGESLASLMAALPIDEAEAEAHTSGAARSRQLAGGGLLLRVGPLLGGDNNIPDDWEEDPSHTPAAAARGARSGAYHPRRTAPLPGALPGGEGNEGAPSCYDRSTRCAAGGGGLGSMRCGAIAANEEGAERRPGQRRGGAASGGAVGGELALEEGNEGSAARAAASAANETAAVKLVAAGLSCELRLGEAREADPDPGRKRARGVPIGQLELDLDLGEINEDTAASARGVTSGHTVLAELNELELELGEAEEKKAASVRGVPSARGTYHAEQLELGELGEAGEEVVARRRGNPIARSARHTTELLELVDLGEAGENAAASARRGAGIRGGVCTACACFKLLQNYTHVHAAHALCRCGCMRRRATGRGHPPSAGRGRRGSGK